MKLKDKLVWRVRFAGSKFLGREPYISWRTLLGICFKSYGQDSSSQPHEILNQDNGTLLVRMPNGIELFFPAEQPLKELRLAYQEICEVHPVVVSEGDWVMQVGAAEGLFGLSVMQQSSKVYLVEPLALWRRCLEKTFFDALRNQKAQILPYALGDVQEKATFYLPDKWAVGASLYKDWAERQEIYAGSMIEVHELKVDVKTLDAIVAENKIERIDFIKADLEGAELPMLKGGLSTLKTFKPKLWLEVYHRFHDFSNILELLTALGYETFYTTGFRRVGPPFGIPKILYAWHLENS